MNDDRRKMLTEYLGECWHEVHSDMEDDGVHRSFCIKCDRDRSYGDYSQRTFTTPQDMVDLVKKMVEKGEWQSFEDYADDEHTGRKYEHPKYTPDLSAIKSGSFTSWLLTDPARTCELIAEWMGEQTPAKHNAT